MDIDIERLKEFECLWPKHATHYCEKAKWFTGDAESACEHCIPRPTKPAAPEWDGEGLPHVGCVCDALISGYEKVYVVGYNYENKLVVEVLSSGMHIPVKKKDANIFRPIRTAEQRHRDELAKLVREAYLEGASEHVGGLIAITDAILSRYNLEPKP